MGQLVRRCLFDLLCVVHALPWLGLSTQTHIEV